MIAHLQGREKLLEIIGFTRQQAERITLVCCTRVCSPETISPSTCRGPTASTSGDSSKPYLMPGSQAGPLPTKESTDGRLICRIFGKQISQVLEIPTAVTAGDLA